MNILYICHYAGSLNYGFEYRPYYLAREWVNNGHNVRIVGGDYSHLRTVQPQIKKDFEKETIDGIEYQWLKTGKYKGNGVKRAITMFTFSLKLRFRYKKILKEFKPDVVITSSTYALDSYAGNKIAKKTHAKYIHEAHDLWPLTLIELGGISAKNPFVVLLGMAEKFAYKHAGKVVSILPNTLEHMLSKGLQSKEKFVAIPNGIALEDWENPEPLNEEHEKVFSTLHKEGKTVICYLGGHAMSNMLDQLLDVAHDLLEEPKYAFVLIGKGVEKEKLAKRVKEENLTNVFLLNPIPKKQVPSALSNADILYIGAAKCKLYRYGVSMNKVYDYMMSAKPILYGVEASNNDVETAKCGVSFEAGNKQEVIKAIEKISNMSIEERSNMGKNGKEWVLKNCEYGELAKKFTSVIEDCPNK